MKLIATKPFTYATRRLRPDDSFTATPRDARILISIGSAKPDTDEKPKRSRKRRSIDKEEPNGLLE